jgi:hypothetical protein
MQLTVGRRYLVVQGLSVLRLSLKEGVQQKPVFSTIEAEQVLEIAGSWLKAPSMLQVACEGRRYAVFTQDLQERVRPIGFEPSYNTATLSSSVLSLPAL